MTGLLRLILPGLGIALVTFVAALHWGLGAESRFLMPFLPAAAIHAAAVAHPASVPVWLVFSAGLAFDVMTHGPLGYWALIYIACHALALVSPAANDAPLVVRWLVFAVTLALLAALEALLSLIYFGHVGDGALLVRAVAGVALAYPFFALVVAALPPAADAARNARLERGA